MKKKWCLMSPSATIKYLSSIIFNQANFWYEKQKKRTAETVSTLTKISYWWNTHPENKMGYYFYTF